MFTNIASKKKNQILCTEPSFFTETSMRSTQSILVFKTEAFWKRQSSKVKPELLAVFILDLFKLYSLLK